MNARTWLKLGIVGAGLVAASSGCRMGDRVNSSTVAKDRSLSPRGQVIPPSGFGVDLVSEPPTRVESYLKANRDPAVEATSR